MPLTVAMLDGVEPRHAGSASGLLQMGQQVGGSLGLAVLVTVYASGNVTGDLVSGLSATYVTAAIFVVLAFGVAVVLLRRRPRPAESAVAVADAELVA
jgi:hypothetical protein